jgi:hypothetical protein
VQDSIKLFFNHPCPYIDFHIRPTNWNTAAGRRRFSVGYKDYFDYSLYVPDAALPFGDIADPVNIVQLQLNSHNRLPNDLHANFLRLYQPLQNAKSIFTGFEYLYCFAVNVFTWNPTSTLNFSKIDHAVLNLVYNRGLPPSEVVIHVSNYNQMIVKNFTSGVRFSD